MTGISELICWNCGQRTPISTDKTRVCIHCEAEIMTSDEAFAEKNNEDFEEYLEIKLDNITQKTIKISEFKQLLDNLFEIKESGINRVPIFLVEPILGVNEAFDQLVERTDNFFSGLKPKLQFVNVRNSKVLAVQFIFVPPYIEKSRRNTFLLISFTFISMILAGMHNYSILKGATTSLQHEVFNVEFSMNSFWYAFQFASTLLFLLILKEVPSLVKIIKNKSPDFLSIFIPAPPSFELGTLGNFVRQGNVPRTKSQMFSTAFYGPVLSWFVSVVLLYLTLSWSYIDEVAATAYASSSSIFNNKYQSFLLSHIGSQIGMNVDSSRLVLHPITMAAIAGVYLNSLYLLPASHLNGGYLLKSISSDSIHGTVTFILILFIMYYQLMIGFLLLIFNFTLGTPIVLNEVEKVSPLQKFLFLVAIFIVILSFPF